MHNFFQVKDGKKKKEFSTVGCCGIIDSCVKTSCNVYVGVKCQVGQGERRRLNYYPS